MTQSPPDGKCANPAGGLCGMPLALRLSEGLGLVRRNVMIGFARDFICWLKMLAPWRTWIALWTFQVLLALAVGWLVGKFGRYWF